MGHDVDASMAQFASDEIIVEQSVSKYHIAGLERVVHLSKEIGFASAFALVRCDGQIVATARRER